LLKLGCRKTLMLKAIAIALLGFLLPPAALPQTPLRVAAAADLQPVLPPILEQFSKATGVEAQATYQASATLTTQIQNGAPFDLFLSADTGFPERLISGGVAEGPTPMLYAKGTLVLWTRKDAHLPAPSIDLLRSASLQRLAIANPESAPYGRAAVAALTNLKLYESLKPRIVTAQNIAQAAQFADSGNADAGMISLTSALTPRLAADGTYFLIPRDLYPAIQQAAVVIKGAPQQAAARRFLDFLLTAPVQAQLAKGGLTPVK
jgi:molybdate transport system substrate-binding protein